MKTENKNEWTSEAGTFKRLSTEEVNKLEDVDFNSYGDALEAHRDATIKSISAELVSKEEIDVLKNELGDVNQALVKVMTASKEQGDYLKTLTVQHKTTGAVKTVRDVLQEKSEEIKSIKNHPLTIFVEKASQAPSDIGDRSDLAQYIDGVEDLARRKPFIKDLFRTVATDTEYIKKTEQDVVVRDAKNVAACAASTHTTKLTWKQTTLQQKKVRDFVHVCIDMMDDYDFVEGEITDLISYGVQIKVDSQLLLGDGAGANLNGIDSYASTFAANLSGADYSVATGTPIQSPTVGDLVCVMGAQIEFLGVDNKFMPNVALLNPKQVKLLKLAKDTQDQYLLPNWLTANGTEVDSIRLISNPLIPEDECYVMDSTMATIYQRKAAEVAMSFENNDNFETETVTVKGYERLNLWISTNNSNAFMKCTGIAAAIIAITKP